MIRKTVLLLAATSLGLAPAAAAQAPTRLETADDVLEWIAAHPKTAGLSVLPPRGRPLRLNPDGRFPLASVRKVLIAGAAADAGRLKGRIPRSAVERYRFPWLPDQSGLEGRRVAVRDVAQAAITVSDNPSADALLARVGARRVDRWARAHGMRRQDPIYPLFGEFAAWSTDPAWTERTPAGRARQARRLTRTVAAADVPRPGLERQRATARVSVAGTPREWSRLMRRIGTHGDPQLQRLLNWPLRRTPALRDDFDRYLTKGGDLFGVITDASFVQPRGRRGTAVALFLRDLPTDTWASLKESFAQQELTRRLATDPAYREKARRLLRR